MDLIKSKFSKLEVDQSQTGSNGPFKTLASTVVEHKIVENTCFYKNGKDQKTYIHYEIIHRAIKTSKNLHLEMLSL